MCEGASKQTPDLKILPRRDRAPRFEIPGSATVIYSCDLLSIKRVSQKYVCKITLTFPELW